MRRLAVHRDFHLQAAVVRGDDLVAEAGGDQQVGLREPLLQQPAGPELAAEFLVVGEVQLDARRASGTPQRFERAQREGVGREVALADRGGAAVELAVDDLAAVRIVRPALAGRHDVAVRVQRDRAARAVAAAHDQVGDRRAGRARCTSSVGHRVLLGREAEAFAAARRCARRAARCCRAACRSAPAPAPAGSALPRRSARRSRRRVAS